MTLVQDHTPQLHAPSTLPFSVSTDKQRGQLGISLAVGFTLTLITGLAAYLMYASFSSAAFWDSSLFVLAPMSFLMVSGLMASGIATFWLIASLSAPNELRQSRLQMAITWAGLSVMAVMTQFTWATMAANLTCGG